MSQNFNKPPEQQHSNVAHLLDQSTTAPPALSPAEIRGLNRKLRVLIRHGGELNELIFHPHRLSPSRQFIKVGGYHSDQLSGWLDIDQIHVVEVLEVMPDEALPTGRNSIIWQEQFSPPRRRGNEQVQTAVLHDTLALRRGTSLLRRSVGRAKVRIRRFTQHA